MPTIKIVSLNSTGLDLKQDDFEISIIEGNKLESHLGLFHDFLMNQQGTMIHIGNPDMKKDKDGGHCAGGIIDWELDSETQFQFRAEYKNDVSTILQIAFDKAPENKVYFLSDYQFGPAGSGFIEDYSLTRFWKEHDSKGINLNTLYKINKN
tara:strand:- start:1242 stop:1697 length:456 start_codon:yes stop_codon:yes gene_type:complete